MADEMRFDGKQFAEMFFASAGYRADAGESIVFGRELEQVMARSFDVKHVQNKARVLFPFNHECSNAVQLVTYRQFNESGSAKFVTDMTDADFPEASASGLEFTTRFQSIGNSYGYSLQDWREAQHVGRPLDQMKGIAARNALERMVEVVAATGDTTHGLAGIANHSSVTVHNTTTTTGVGYSGHVWVGAGANATVQEMFSDLAAAAKYVNVSTLLLEEVDTVAFPSTIWGMLKSTLFQPTYNTKTVLQAMLEANPWIKNVDVWLRLDTASAASLGRIMLYKRDSSVMEFMVSQEFESFPPQIRGARFSIQNHMRIGGFQVRYPRAILYLDGADGG